VAFVATPAAPVLADSGDDATPRVEGAHPGHEAVEAPEAVAARPRAIVAPLTRAAVRARIEGIDPEGWLARFGAVDRRPTAGH
jgi:hypothetical protein